MNPKLHFISLAIALAFADQSYCRQHADAPTAPEVGPYTHLRLAEGGPEWSLSDLRAMIAPGTTPMEVDPRIPISRIDDPAKAMLAALLRLESIDKREHEQAFRIAGATAKLSAHQDAVRLLSYMIYHGIGIKSDSTAAVRSALPLIRVGDLQACEFAAKTSPATFKSATNPTSLEKLAKTKQRLPVRFGGMISEVGSTSLKIDKSDQEIEVERIDDTIRIGRHVDVWGLMIDKSFRALITEVPEPQASFKWKVNASSVRGGTWQVHSVKVTVLNNGLQPIKSVQFSVRCFINDGAVNDQTQQAEITDIPPGKSKSVDVGFEMYNYQYIDAVSVPKAKVDVNKTDW